MIRIALLSALLGLGACAKKTPDAAGASSKLPDAYELFDAHTKADGSAGKGLYSMVAKLELDMLGMSLTGELKLLPPNQLYVTTDMPGVGQLSRGFDGTTAWELNPMSGPRLIVGDELEALRIEADQGLASDYRKLYPIATTVSRETFDGQDAFKVEATNLAGSAKTIWFDTSNHLMLGSRELVTTEMGQVDATTYLREYASFDGLMVPTSMTQDMGSMQFTTRMVDIQIGVEVEPVPMPEIIAELLREQDQ